MEENFYTGLMSIWNSLYTWITNNIDIVFEVILILILAKIVSLFLKKSLTKVLSHSIRSDMYPSKADRDKRVQTLTSITNAIIGFTIWTIAVIMVLQKIGVNTAPILASAGIIGVALGFGAQSLVKDFMTGMFIIAENQYRVGDYVEIGAVKGTVKAVTIRTTVVTDSDGSIYHIPNGSIVVTANKTMGNNKLVVEITVAPDSDIDKVRKAIDRAGKKLAAQKDWVDLINDPPHFVRVSQLSGGGMVIRIHAKVRESKQNALRSEYYTVLLQEFAKDKIVLK